MASRSNAGGKICIALLIIFTGCAAVSALKPPADPALQKGFSLYKNKCGGCHRLYEPESRSAAEWQRIVVEMEKKVPLTIDEEQELLRYLIAFPPERQAGR